MLEWKEEWGEIGCYKASVIAEKLGCTIEQARALKLGEKPIESEAENGN